jgi:hypothetical protein
MILPGKHEGLRKPIRENLKSLSWTFWRLRKPDKIRETSNLLYKKFESGCRGFRTKVSMMVKRKTPKSCIAFGRFHILQT